ncbi:hypothetical protein L6452_33662 [Arctium lappa]|uniref:Uncharacterized protein n=1 Tax=Arctium lappa TaxID=4217 RepID=A0ACB8YH04_ARCLA|nr:hypothetical protein L6452_33662 [Arctium lappa]
MFRVIENPQERHETAERRAEKTDSKKKKKKRSEEHNDLTPNPNSNPNPKTPKENPQFDSTFAVCKKVSDLKILVD